MMKILKKIFVLILVAFCFASCKTLDIQIKEYEPVAIMTFYSNPGVTWYDPHPQTNDPQPTDEGILTGMLNRALDKNNPETLTGQERIDYAASYFVKALSNAGVSVISPDVLKNAPAYAKSGKSFFDDMRNTLPAAGYDVFTNSSRKLNKEMAAFTGSRCLLYVHFKFQKVKVHQGYKDSGVAARFIMTVYGADENGKTLFNREYTMVSTDTVPMRNNSFERSKLVNLFPPLIEQGIDKFVYDFVLKFNAMEDDQPADLESTSVESEEGDSSEEIIHIEKEETTRISIPRKVDTVIKE